MNVPAAARIRTDRLRAAFAVVPPVTHVGQAVIFAGLAPLDATYGWLSGLSVLAVAWFAFCGWLYRTDRAWLATWCVWAEVLGHSAVLHLAFGGEAWFRAYPIVLSAASLGLFRADETRSRAVGFGLAILAAALEGGITTEPWIAADAWVVDALAQINGVTAVACALVFMVVLLAASERAERDAETEHERAEALLRNVLPVRVAERLKADPGALAEAAEDVTVLFADLVGFTPMAASRPAAEVVAILDRAFTRFDEIAARHGLEKIKTIGDAYLAVAGLPDPHPDGPASAASAALDLIREVGELSTELGVPLDLRVGLHTGPVVAGVIGSRRKAYDLWGDTVNLAGRMESHGEPGRVQVTAATAARLPPRFQVVERGPVQVKGKGEVMTFWVTEAGARPPGPTP